jgi:hypothetical protein
MKKKRLVLKTETVREMRSRELGQVVGGTLVFTGHASCWNCFVNTTIGNSTVSMPATLCLTSIGGGGGGGYGP